ncbi:MAG: peptidyl-prolyl cis-trans isomerase [bacterium]|nr:peptidyl-prolyl cis-trans isomerase [bacterium]
MKRNKNFILLIIMIASLLFFSSCDNKKDKVIIKINDYKIYESELNSARELFRNATDEELIEMIIKRNILYLEALRLDLDKSEKIQKKLEHQQKSINFQIFYEETIKDKVIVSEEEIKSEFEENKYRFNNPDYESMKEFFEKKVRRNKEEELVNEYANSLRSKYKIEVKTDLIKDAEWPKVKDNSIILVIINDEIKISSNELAAEIRYMKGIDRYFTDTFEQREKLLNVIINRKIFLSEAEKKDYTKTKKFKNQYERYLKDQLIQTMLYVHIPSQLMITEEEMKEFYEQNKQRYYTPELVHVQHILFDDEKKAQEISAKIKKAKDPVAEFKKLALEYARGPDSVKNLAGDLGFIQRGVMSDAFDDAAFSLGINEISEIVKTEYGYHLILLLERQPEVYIEFNKVKNQINKELFDKRKDTIVEEYYNGIKKEYKVKILYKKKEHDTNVSKEKVQETK